MVIPSISGGKNMICTVTFNPAIDYIAKTDNLCFGETNRSACEEIFFGGKGINVSCVLKELGVDSVALGFIAGFTGKALETHLKEKGIKTDFITLPYGFTRINVKLKGKQITEINGSGPKIDNESLNLLFEKLDKLTSEDTLILSGSIPSSLPADIYEQIMKKLENRNIRFVVDASGKLLVNSLKYKPFMIKPNKAELSEIFGKTLETEKEIISCAAKLQKLGALNVLITLGADGAILLNENGEIIRKPAHKIQAVNTVGAGDSMVAGFIAGIDKGSDYALNLGRACASATTTEMGLASYQKIIEFMK